MVSIRDFFKDNTKAALTDIFQFVREEYENQSGNPFARVVNPVQRKSKILDFLSYMPALALALIICLITLKGNKIIEFDGQFSNQFGILRNGFAMITVGMIVGNLIYWFNTYYHKAEFKLAELPVASLSGAGVASALQLIFCVIHPISMVSLVDVEGNPIQPGSVIVSLNEAQAMEVIVGASIMLYLGLRELVGFRHSIMNDAGNNDKSLGDWPYEPPS